MTDAKNSPEDMYIDRRNMLAATLTTAGAGHEANAPDHGSHFR
jgi:hypothetical protein